MKKVFSGIQPSGTLTIGNYIGALKQFAQLQAEHECIFSIVDLHAITQEYPVDIMPQRIFEAALDFLACGIDPEKSTLFVQSDRPEHTELAWLLGTITPLGELQRMTQFKEKSAKSHEIDAGLLNYPILMAADILIYKAEEVPVGEDQVQHLELTREIARQFNKKFGATFTEPKALMSKIPRLMSLDDPTKKMSKSLPNGCLFIDDSPETIREKIKRAVTDSGSEIKYDETNKPAVSNLMLIYSELSGKNLNEIEKKFSGKQYSNFKNDLTNTIIEYFRPFNERKTKLLKEKTKIAKIVTAGNKKALAIAKKKIEEVKQKIFAL